MAVNEIGEKIYYSDDLTKVTNIRISCHHVSVPVDKIEGVDINLKSEALCIRLSLMLISLSLLLFIPVMPAHLRVAVGILLGVIAIASAFWFYLLMREYAELIVFVANRKITIMSAHIFNRVALLNIKKAIDDALMDERKFCELKKENNSAVKFNPSETLRLKLMLEDYDRLKEVAKKAGLDTPQT